jgi:hypothetical protein
MPRASKKEQAGKIIGRFLTIGLSGVRTIGRLLVERLSSCHNFFTNFFPAATLLPSQRLPYTPQW